MRVPMRSIGADQLIVAMKGGNAPGAKELDYSAGFRSQPVNGRNP